MDYLLWPNKSPIWSSSLGHEYLSSDSRQNANQARETNRAPEMSSQKGKQLRHVRVTEWVAFDRAQSDFIKNTPTLIKKHKWRQVTQTIDFLAQNLWLFFKLMEGLYQHFSLSVWMCVCKDCNLYLCPLLNKIPDDEPILIGLRLNGCLQVTTQAWTLVLKFVTLDQRLN